MINKIVMAADENYVIGAVGLLASIGQNTGEEILNRLRVLFAYEASQLSQESISLLTQVCDHYGITLEMEQFVPGSQITRRHISSTTFAKFHFLETSREAFLWLDTDTVVLSGWTKILDSFQMLDEDHPYLIVKRPDGTSHSPNAGVFGALPGHPIKNWQSRVGNHELSLEQHIFQGEFSKKSVAVDPSFNVINIWGQQTIPVASIRHYAGPIKPWHLSGKSKDRCLEIRCTWGTWHEINAKLLEEKNFGNPTRQASLKSVQMLDRKYKIILSLLRITGFIPKGFGIEQFIKRISVKMGLAGAIHPVH